MEGPRVQGLREALHLRGPLALLSEGAMRLNRLGTLWRQEVAVGLSWTLRS